MEHTQHPAKLALSHTHYSLRQCIIKPKDLVKRSKELGYTHVAIMDYCNMSACCELYEECIENDLTPVIGMKVIITKGPSEEKEGLDELILLAKNQSGWRQILNIALEINSHEKYDGRDKLGKISYSDLVGLETSDIYVLSGFSNSTIRNSIFSIKDNRESVLKSEFNKYSSDFEYFYLVSDIGKPEDDEFISLCEKSGTRFNTITNPFYLNQEDCQDHHVLIATKLNMNLQNAKRHVSYKNFFSTNSYFLHDGCDLDLEFDTYDILSEPKLPAFECPNNLSANDYLLQLCREGWHRIKHNLHKPVEEYAQRVKNETAVFTEFHLSGYMLIVKDLIDHLKNDGALVRVRGSCYGSLVAYLMGITDGDPLEYDLYFERFMNKGRMSKDRISLPDIDIDVPPELRDKAIDYLKDKYGEPCVAQLPTFGKLKAKAVIKGVLRAHNACSPKEMDELTKHIPEDAKVSDELAETKQSLLDWSIDNVPELWNYVKRHDGELIGDYAEYFEQALRLEGTFQSIGKHAGGVIVCSEPIVDCCPMVMQSDGSEPIVGVEMNAAEKMGLVKIDVLGLEMLSKLMYINQMLMGEL